MSSTSHQRIHYFLSKINFGPILFYYFRELKKNQVLFVLAMCVLVMSCQWLVVTFISSFVHYIVNPLTLSYFTSNKNLNQVFFLKLLQFIFCKHSIRSYENNTSYRLEFHVELVFGVLCNTFFPQGRLLGCMSASPSTMLVHPTSNLFHCSSTL